METSLAAWENFYIIVRSSAGALTGLQFVVLALVAERRPERSVFRRRRKGGGPVD